MQYNDFVIGHVYSIKKKTGNGERDPDRTGSEVRFFFQYKGKQGIHHCFTEIHGGWNRTYTDYQLIGKKIKEIKEWRK